MLKLIPAGTKLYTATPPTPQHDARKVIEQMVFALQNANNSGPFPLFTEAIQAGQQWLKENK